MEKILIIDDDEGMRKSLTILISREGYTVDTLPGSNGADELIKEFKPNLVLTDHNLGIGEEEGFTLAQRLKANSIKVMLMSADLHIGKKAKTMGLPFIQKPFSVKSLLNQMKEVIYGE